MILPGRNIVMSVADEAIVMASAESMHASDFVDKKIKGKKHA
jgi:hypothetical protein